MTKEDHAKLVKYLENQLEERGYELLPNTRIDPRDDVQFRLMLKGKFVKWLLVPLDDIRPVPDNDNDVVIMEMGEAEKFISSGLQ